jgi:UDP-N-acetylmuramate--alanine ligase
MMHQGKYNSVFFIGIGGIGMSALARYFKARGIQVFGYDRVKSALTDELERLGIQITFEDQRSHVIESLMPSDCLVVYTPAIPANNIVLNYFTSKQFRVIKRAEALGEITRSSKSIGVAGTHGKSTTSCMLAYLMRNSAEGCNAFLGAISTNFKTNFLVDEHSGFSVVEADEFDRSFLFLSPFAAIITTIDPDHLDIYGTAEKFKEGFRQFAMKIDPNGFLLIKEGVSVGSLCKQKTYALESHSADYSAYNLKDTSSGCTFDFRTPKGVINNVNIGINGLHNAENAVAALAVVSELGLDVATIASSFAGFQGIKRRFERIYEDEQLVYIDDYAHHPMELKRLIESVRAMYPTQHITGVFQPHLFSRTKDFADGFADQLSMLDEVILLPIYPARELPIQGVDSAWLLTKIKSQAKSLVNPSELLDLLRIKQHGVLLTIGAGDIDRLVEPIKEMLEINRSQV